MMTMAESRQNAINWRFGLILGDMMRENAGKVPTFERTSEGIYTMSFGNDLWVDWSFDVNGNVNWVDFE